ncbi:MAG: hypothetical protein C4547_05150 [Phycisphaerales bacterium]|nr:MAG: hypothetical protein C4547_05150 [Phycisphaerales bacterium]
MSDEIDWELTTFEGNRRLQRQHFRALPLHEKFMIVEQMGEVCAFFAARRRARMAKGIESVDGADSRPSRERTDSSFG